MYNIYMEDLSKDPALQEALKQFEVKNTEQQILHPPQISSRIESPKMIRWVMKYFGKTIKTEEQAEYALLGFVVIIVIITIIIFFAGNGTEVPLTDPYFT
jgi:hypothetical protein